MHRKRAVIRYVQVILLTAFFMGSGSAYADLVTFPGSAGRIGSSSSLPCTSGIDWTMGTALCVQSGIDYANNVKISSGDLELLTGAQLSGSWSADNLVYTATYGAGSFYITGKEGSLPDGTTLMQAAFTGATFTVTCPTSSATDCTGSFSLNYTPTSFNSTLWTDLGFTSAAPPPGSGSFVLSDMKIKLDSPLQPGGTTGQIHSTSFTTNGNLSTTPVPEPTSLMLLGTALLAIGGILRRKL